MTTIVKWAAIQKHFSQGLIIGNGASIGISDRFNYPSLYQAAQDGNFLTSATRAVFTSFDSTDFELVLRRLWQATLVNQALQIGNNRVDEAYAEVRKSLISTVHAIHPAYDEVKKHFSAMGSFLKGFQTVTSANYDLMLYWAAMWNNDDGFGRWFKDGFITADGKATFRDDWQVLRQPYRADGATLYFYPHGNLCLGTEAEGSEIKIAAGGENLLQTITDQWEQGAVTPLFVSEGTTEKKLTAIRRSNYLSRVHFEVLDSLGDAVAFYGLGFWAHDEHLIQRATKRAKSVAVSVYRGEQKMIDRASSMLEKAGVEKVTFFDAESPGAWIYA
ncbi:DUF4917 family protein [Bradyrhizobium sp. SEMIA]|uniref:DUF4917 family protein n=1 Tax=Bradyrhizobium sp. SEMIA TaxID=2597515 RepID=UPI0018A68FC2|nr:DUF4917 family protein [Bradyrhizobium sp. SEMIA]QOG20573.1 DUF4917 family protein [Bradyrhizobium sp. SEMIA]